MNPCPLCGESAGYALSEGCTYRWWGVSCKACGNQLSECHADRRHPHGTPLPKQWPAADEHWAQVSRYAADLKRKLEATESLLNGALRLLNVSSTDLIAAAEDRP